MKLFKGHSDYINGIVFEPESGELVGTCSDDHTAKLWDTNSGTCLHTFHLTSPGYIILFNRFNFGANFFKSLLFLTLTIQFTFDVMFF